jgi:hypothetical protein
VKSLASLPAVFGGAKTDWSSYRESDFSMSAWNVGQGFIEANAVDGENWFRWFQYPRWATLPLSLLGGQVCYYSARELYGGPDFSHC